MERMETTDDRHVTQHKKTPIRPTRNKTKKNKKKRRHFLMQSYNMVPLIATAKHGRPNAVIRIVEWSITVPFLLSLVGASVFCLPVNEHGSGRQPQSIAPPPKARQHRVCVYVLCWHAPSHPTD
jgi:hypothetical protein